MKKLIFLCCFALLTTVGSHLLNAQIKVIDESINPLNLTEYNGALYFNADDGTHGRELWKSDGTEAGTQLVKDIFPGNYGSSPRSFIEANGTLFFVARDEVHRYELWKSDGTEAGTQLVKDIYPGSDDAMPERLTEANGKLFFVFSDEYYNCYNYELWMSDGTEAGTQLVKDINPGCDGSYPYSLTEVNGTLFFTARDEVHGYELWKSDGTEVGTQLVKDIFPGFDTHWPYSLTEVNGTLFFTARDEVHGYELWKSDGTEAGTQLVKDIFPGFDHHTPLSLTEVNGTLFFTTSSDEVHGYELWKSDGTEAGTQLVKSINYSSDFQPLFVFMIDIDGTLFFFSHYFDLNSYSEFLTELWKSDGTEAGTQLIKSLGVSDNLFTEFIRTEFNGMLFFQGYDAVHGKELWKSDGTADGTVLVKDIRPGSGGGSSPRDFTEFNGALYFSARDGTGSYLWKYSAQSCEITQSETLNQTDCDPGNYNYSQDLEITFSNAPGSGMLNVNGQPFPIGTSPQSVTLTELDADGLPVSVNAYFTEDPGCSFSAPDLFVAPVQCTPSQNVDDLMDDIRDLLDEGELAEKDTSKLIGKLNSILTFIDNGQINAAVGMLGAFINNINSLLNQGVLSPEDASYLISQANIIINQLTGGARRSDQPAVSIQLEQNIPNPLTNETIISYSIPQEGYVTLQIHNLNGTLIESVVEAIKQAGRHQIRFKAGNLPEGIYFYTLQIDNFRITKRMVVMR